MPQLAAAHLRAVLAAQRAIMERGPDLDGVMALTVERTQAVTGATAAAVELVEGEELVYRAASGTAAPYVGLRLASAHSLSGLCVRTEQILECSDARSDARVDRAACERLGVRSMMVVPLFHEQRCVGVLKVMSAQPCAFGPDALAVLEIMTGFVAAAMAHAAAQDALATSESRFRAVVEMAQDAIFSADRGGRIVSWNASAQRMFGYSATEILGRHVRDLIPERLRAGHDAALATYAPDDSPLVGRTLELAALHRDGSEFPVELSVSSWQSSQGSFFTGIARDISERVRLHEALVAALRTDALTGMLIRSVGEQQLRDEAARADRYDRELTVCLLDLDHFKTINDTHGHAAGDEVLASTGETLRTSLRGSDFAVRWGGEEFLLGLPDTSLEHAHQVAARVRSAVRTLRFGHVGEVSVSGGVAAHQRGEDVSRTVARADQRLYEAKRSGRDRIL